jgi:hypothetical protein
MARGRKMSLVMILSPQARATWECWQRSTTMAAGLARRGRMLLLLAERYSPSQAAQGVGVQRGVVRKGAQRFLAHRLDGLVETPGRGATGGFPPAGAIHVVRLARERPNRLGRGLAPWDGAALARQRIAEGLVEDISAATGRRLLTARQPRPRLSPSLPAQPPPGPIGTSRSPHALARSTSLRPSIPARGKSMGRVTTAHGSEHAWPCGNTGIGRVLRTSERFISCVTM